jgi:succinate-semialdehyde dehydrogenase/glutarate-semialdehyde dehydrogenase
MPIQSVNPANGLLLRSFTPLTDDALLQKIGLAEIAFGLYAEVPLSHRALCMRKLAYLLEYETDDLAALITAEMGKPIVEARAEVAKCASVCRYYAEHAARILAPEPIDAAPNDVYVRWDPLGVVLAVMPWNFPFWQVFRFLAPALMAGNVGLLKPASIVPQCALAIEALVRRAGFPRGTFQTLLIEAGQVELVVADERVAAVTVTGSEAAGRSIAAQAGWFIKKSVLELGGSDPFIVMPSADLEAAVEAAVRARCINSGQSCIAAKRVIVADSIYDKFEVRFVARMIAMKVGDPTREETDIGPLATPAQVEQLELQVQAAIRAGARTLTGGRRREGQGNYYEPTVLTGVPRDCGVFREELFGPVAMLFRVRDAEEAIGLANDSPFGLGASVWTRSHAEQKQFALGLQCGGVFLNAPVSSDPRLPFGGTKHSGYGRELSAAGMREFLNAKTVVIADPLAADVADSAQEPVVAEGEPARLEVAVRQQVTARAEAAAVPKTTTTPEVAPTAEEDATVLLSRLSIISRKADDSK